MRQVNLVNERDEVIGHVDLISAHRGSGQKHQAVSWFLFHRSSDGSLKLLLQQRSGKKIVGAGQWANTLCANLIPEETHVACVKRRAKEELGVDWQENWLLEEVAVLDYQVACENGFAENEFDHFFVTVLDDKAFVKLKIDLNPDEVENYVWLSWTDVKAKQLGDRQITPWLNLFLDESDLIRKIEQVCKK